MQDKDVLDRLGREVLSAGPGASLPSQLSDEWIQIATESIHDFLNDRSQSAAASCIGVSLVIKTLWDKDPENDCIEVPLETLCKYLETYLVEMTLESISRSSDIRASPATLETIFETDRRVKLVRRLPCSLVSDASDSPQ